MAGAGLGSGDVDGVEGEEVSASVRYTVVPYGADLLIDGKVVGSIFQVIRIFDRRGQLRPNVRAPVSVVVEAAVAVIAGGLVGRLQKQMVGFAQIKLRSRSEKTGSASPSFSKERETIAPQGTSYKACLITVIIRPIINPRICALRRGGSIGEITTAAAVVKHADRNAVGFAVHGGHRVELLRPGVGHDAGKGERHGIVAGAGTEHHVAVLDHKPITAVLVDVIVPPLHGGVVLGGGNPAGKPDAAVGIEMVVRDDLVAVGRRPQDFFGPGILEDVIAVRLACRGPVVRTGGHVPDRADLTAEGDGGAVVVGADRVARAVDHKILVAAGERVVDGGVNDDIVNVLSLYILAVNALHFVRSVFDGGVFGQIRSVFVDIGKEDVRASRANRKGTDIASFLVNQAFTIGN